MPRLFDNFERTNSRVSTHQESAFGFYNRIATPGWSTVRDEIERWFGLLRALYLQGRIDAEPQQDSVSTRPDFAVLGEAPETVELFVESVTTFAGIIEDEERSSGLVAYVLDTINEIQSADFRIYLDLRSVGVEQPRKREIKRPIEAWLATLNREVQRARRLERRRHRERIRFRDWEIEVEPLAKGTPGTDPNDRLIGIGPGVGGFVNDTEYIKAAVLGKAQRYGALAAPFVIAVAPTSPVVHNEDVVAALFGSTWQHFDPDHPEGGEVVRQQDGAWPVGADEVAGVLTGTAILRWTVAQVPPTLWLNPKTPPPFGERLQMLRRVEFTDAGEPATHEASISIAELLELSPEWPGDVWATLG